MTRSCAHLAVIAVALQCVDGCKKTETTVLSHPAPSASAKAVASAPTDSQFSLPVAGVRTKGGGIAAGLIANEKVVRAERLADDGRVEWTRDLLSDATWSPQTELHGVPTASGAVFVWRGLVSGRRHLSAVFVSDSGRASAPFELGSSWCANLDGIVSSQPNGNGETVLSGRRPDADVTVPLGSIRSDAEVSLVCGDHRAFALVDADEDLGVVSLGFGSDANAKTKIVPLLRHRDFGKDDEREREPFTVGDTLFLLRIGASGGVALRELGPASPLPWRKLHTQFGPDDELVAVDGDGSSIALLFSRDAGDACPNDAASAVSMHAIRLDPHGETEAEQVLSAAKCGTRFGPFWLSPAKGLLLASWAELAGSPERQNLASTAVAFRTVVPEDTDVHRVVQAAETIASVSCEEAGGCYAFALARPTDYDGGAPEPIRMLKLR